MLFIKRLKPVSISSNCWTFWQAYLQSCFRFSTISSSPLSLKGPLQAKLIIFCSRLRLFYLSETKISTDCNFYWSFIGFAIHMDIPSCIHLAASSPSHTLSRGSERRKTCCILMGLPIWRPAKTWRIARVYMVFVGRHNYKYSTKCHCAMSYFQRRKILWKSVLRHFSLCHRGKYSRNLQPTPNASILTCDIISLWLFKNIRVHQQCECVSRKYNRSEIISSPVNLSDVFLTITRQLLIVECVNP